MKTDNVTIPRYEIDDLITTLEQAAKNAEILIGHEIESKKRAEEMGYFYISLEGFYRLDFEAINAAIKKLSSL